jgi:hypothetical protein
MLPLLSPYFGSRFLNRKLVGQHIVSDNELFISVLLCGHSLAYHCTFLCDFFSNEIEKTYM